MSMGNWTKEALIKKIQEQTEYIADKECQIFVLAKTNKESKLIADSEADSFKEFMNYQLRQKDGIIDRLNETIESEETENIALENKIAKVLKLIRDAPIPVEELPEEIEKILANEKTQGEQK